MVLLISLCRRVTNHDVLGLKLQHDTIWCSVAGGPCCENSRGFQFSHNMLHRDAARPPFKTLPIQNINSAEKRLQPINMSADHKWLSCHSLSQWRENPSCIVLISDICWIKCSTPTPSTLLILQYYIPVPCTLLTLQYFIPSSWTLLRNNQDAAEGWCCYATTTKWFSQG